MNDTHTTLALTYTARKETSHGQARLVAHHAMQVEFGLNGPVTTAQTTQGVALHAAAQKRRRIAIGYLGIIAEEAIA